jgi:hypothetical protein
MEAKIVVKKMMDRLMEKLGYVPSPLDEDTIHLKFDYLDGNGNVVFKYHPMLNLQRGDTVQVDFIPTMVISSDDARITAHGKDFLCCHLSEEWKTMIKKIFITIE